MITDGSGGRYTTLKGLAVNRRDRIKGTTALDKGSKAVVIHLT